MFNTRCNTMAVLFGQCYSRQEILSHVGDIQQVAGIRMMELCDGLERGVRIADVRTGSGLRFQVSLDRGMDLSVAEYRGVPLAFRSPNGDVHPHRFEPEGFDWQRGFAGGLMTGCGMTQVGSPCVDEGTALGQHGRLSTLSASAVHQSTRWEGDEYVMCLNGEVRETTPFKENLLLLRTIETRLGESVITIRDVVINEGDHAAPLMMLYHVNAGWPVVNETARLYLHDACTEPRDADARSGLPDARVFCSPAPGYREQVFYHTLAGDTDGFATAMIADGHKNLGLFVRYRQAELPRFIEWKMMGCGFYAVGMEPANCLVGGRAKERAQGTLQFLAPGEERHFLVQIGVVDGEHALNQFTEENGLQ
jgi:hypothetical protein